jgi:hypothetical protein
MTDSKNGWPAAVVAVALIALVGVMFWRATDKDFATIWAGVGTIVGVVTGSIPAYFFRTEAIKASSRAEAIAGAAPPGTVEQARKAAPEAFR